MVFLPFALPDRCQHSCERAKMVQAFPEAGGGTSMPRFAAIGPDHRHVYDLTQNLLDAGAECAGYNPDTTDPRVLAGFRRRFPHVPASETQRLLDNPAIDFVVIAARPCDRADLAIAAMRCGKDVMVDKPGVTTFDHLDAVERAVRETGRIWSVCLGRLASPAVQEALHVVRSGELGRLVHTTSLAPHRLNRALRPSWFFDTPAYGGIINDIGVHSIDQFLAFADADAAEIVSCTVGAFGTDPPGFEDFAELVLATPTLRGYIRLDWFTPDGLPTWGDGRFFVVGTEGTLELRKNLDIEGRDGTDHMFIANKASTRYVDCSSLTVTYYRDFLHGIANRTETAMPQRQVFAVCRLALQAQALAARYTARRV
jgi:predicted dehydrogenase